MISFPKNFLWGAATSAYQVEGNNQNSDWWEWEKRVNLKQTSGQACRHYQLFLEDFDLAKSLNHNAHRLSIEWSRIQPQEDTFSQQEIAHYCDVLTALQKRSLEPVVTLHHFTNPIWFAEIDGWENKNSVDYFLNYVGCIAEALADKVKYWVTINEPMVYLYYSYVDGAWPPQKRSVFKAKKVFDNLILAHIKAYQLINTIYKKKGLSSPLISIAQNMQAFEFCRNLPRNKFAVFLKEWIFNLRVLDILNRRRTLDYIGLNYYSRNLTDARDWSFKELFIYGCTEGHSKLKKNSMGWDIYPQGLYKVLLSIKKYKLPVFILENGICTSDDNQRWEYVFEHLKSLNLAMQQGVEVLGYLYWSLLDNYEWDKGFVPRFGLVDVDYNTYERRVKESAKKLSLVCKTGILE